MYVSRRKIHKTVQWADGNFTEMSGTAKIKWIMNNERFITFAYQITGDMLTSTSLHFTRKRPLSIDVGVEGHVLNTTLERVKKSKNMRKHAFIGSKKC